MLSLASAEFLRLKFLDVVAKFDFSGAFADGPSGDGEPLPLPDPPLLLSICKGNIG